MRQSKHTLAALGVAVGLWCAMLLGLEAGRRVGLSHLQRWGAETHKSVDTVDGAIYGVLSLLIGFTFAGAAGRFDRRRELVAGEANAIGTAWQRIDLLGADQQKAVRPLFRHYLDALIASYSTDPDPTDLTRQPASVTQAQDAVWTSAVASCLTPVGEPARVLLIPSLNEMFGAVDRERTMRRIHPPPLIFAMLVLTELAAALFAGYTLASMPVRNWFYIVSVATSIAFVTYVIIELEYPRLGLVRIDAMDRELLDLRDAMSDDAPIPAPAIHIPARRSG